jgi:hypothetical protein
VKIKTKAINKEARPDNKLTIQKGGSTEWCGWNDCKDDRSWTMAQPRAEAPTSNKRGSRYACKAKGARDEACFVLAQ